MTALNIPQRYPTNTMSNFIWNLFQFLGDVKLIFILEIAVGDGILLPEFAEAGTSASFSGCTGIMP